ncbi:hypothetical protein GALL_405860 [mine drainage metagenome]|uniref:Uncharacterized protein n=1 Tax=mine drainage metagenome TaxID=410659 RepID=A0A1J5Q334_9ZZZZ
MMLRSVSASMTLVETLSSATLMRVDSSAILRVSFISKPRRICRERSALRMPASSLSPAALKWTLTLPSAIEAMCLVTSATVREILRPSVTAMARPAAKASAETSMEVVWLKAVAPNPNMRKMTAGGRITLAIILLTMGRASRRAASCAGSAGFGMAPPEFRCRYSASVSSICLRDGLLRTDM